jgi:hypothetical protein
LAGCTPTDVDLSNFVAMTLPQGIQLIWQTAQESDLVGFNLYRSTSLDGSKEMINTGLIPAINPGELRGNNYAYLDSKIETGIGYYYWVEWIGNQDTQLFGPTLSHLVPYWMWLPIGLR